MPLHWRQLSNATLPLVMHLLLAVGGATLSTMALHCRWTHDTMRAYTDKLEPAVRHQRRCHPGGHFPKHFSKQCFVGRLQVPVPHEYVEALMPGIFGLQDQLQQQYQRAPNKASVNHSRIRACGHPHHAG